MLVIAHAFDAVLFQHAQAVVEPPVLFALDAKGDGVAAAGPGHHARNRGRIFQHVGHGGFRPDRQIGGGAFGGQGQKAVQMLIGQRLIPFQLLRGIRLDQPQGRGQGRGQRLRQTPKAKARDSQQQCRRPKGATLAPKDRQGRRQQGDQRQARGAKQGRQLIKRRTNPDMPDHGPGKAGEDHPAQPFERGEGQGKAKRRNRHPERQRGRHPPEQAQPPGQEDDRERRHPAMPGNVDEERLDDPGQRQGEMPGAGDKPQPEGLPAAVGAQDQPDQTGQTGQCRPPEPQGRLTKRHHCPQGKGKGKAKGPGLQPVTPDVTQGSGRA